MTTNRPVADAPATTPTPLSIRPRVRRRIRVAWPAALILAVLLPAIADSFTVSLASSAIVLAVLAMSVQFLVGVAGLPTLGQAALLGVGAYTAALMATHGFTIAPGQLLAAAIAGGAAAAITGPVVLRTRGTAFMISTFALQGVLVTIAVQWTSLTGGESGLHTPPVTLWPSSWQLSHPAHLYWYVLACGILLAATLAAILRKSRLALVLRGQADNEARMTALGYRVTAQLTAGYAIAGAVAGAGGALLVAVNRYVSPTDAGFELAALALLAAAIGRTMTGAIVGAIAIVIARDVIGGSTGGHADLVLGLLFITAAYRTPARAAIGRALERRRRAAEDSRADDATHGQTLHGSAPGGTPT
jgi:branched-chain amino acid transport system permease protein